MKSRVLFKTVSALLLIVILIPLISACADTKADNKVKVDNVFKSEYLTIPNEFQPSGKMTYIDGKIYMPGYETTDYRNTIYTINTDGSDGRFIDLLPSNDDTGASRYINTMIISANGNILYIYNEYFYDEETYTSTETSYLTIKDIEGNTIQDLDLTEMFKKDTDSYFYIYNMFVDKNNNIFLTTDRYVYILDESCNHLFTLEMAENTYINTIVTTRQGDTILIYNDYSSETSNTYGKVIDFNKKQLGNDYDISNIPTQYLYNLIPSGDDKYDYFYDDNFSIYGLNLSTGTTTEIINWINSDIDTSYSNSFCIISSDELICAGYDYLNDKSQVMMLERVPEDQVVEKYILTLAAFSLDSRIKSYVIDFNRNNLEYRIQIEDYYKYSTSDDYYAGITKLNTDISTGKIPDILFFSGYNMDINNYNAKGVFADFNKFIEEDPEINRSDYFENLLDAAQYNGKLYQLFTGFNLQTVVGKTKFFGHMDGWTIDDFTTFMATQPNGTFSFQNITQKDMLNRYCSMMIDDFIDKNTGRCNFDSEGFIKVLEFCKTLDSKYYWEDPNYDYEQHWEEFQYAYKEDRVLLLDYYLYGFDYFWDTRQVEFGEDITFIGMPTESKQGSAVTLTNEFSMSAKTKHPEGVWSFLRQFIMDDYLSNSYYYGFTIKRSLVDEQAEKALNPEQNDYYYGGVYPAPVVVEEVYETQIDEEAPTVEEAPVPAKRENIRYINDEPVDIGFITREYVDMIIDLIESTDKIIRYDNDMIDIILEEAGEFFEGQKTSAETAKVIQNRLQNYIDEKR